MKAILNHHPAASKERLISKLDRMLHDGHDTKGNSPRGTEQKEVTPKPDQQTAERERSPSPIAFPSFDEPADELPSKVTAEVPGNADMDVSAVEVTPASTEGAGGGVRRSRSRSKSPAVKRSNSKRRRRST